MSAKVVFLFSLIAATITAQPVPEIGDTLRHGASHEISIIYSEPVDVATLGNLENYGVAPGTLANLRLVATNQGVILTVSGLGANSSGNITVSNIQDTSGNSVAPANLAFTTSSNRFWAIIGANELGFDNDTVAFPEDGYDLLSGGIQQRDEYDELTFMGQEVTGDFDVKVRVEDLESAGAGAKAGIMIREHPQDEGKTRSLDPDDAQQAFSRYVQLAVSRSSTSHQIWQRAVSTGTITASLTVTNDAAPSYPNAWLRVERIGQTFNMYRGKDGAAWQKIGGATFNPPITNTYVGLAFSAQNDDFPPGSSLKKAYIAKFREYAIEIDDVVIGEGNLRIAHMGTHAEITWDAGWTLQSAPTVTGGWTNVSPQQSPQRVNFTEAMSFFRLRR